MTKTTKRRGKANFEAAVFPAQQIKKLVWQAWKKAAKNNHWRKDALSRGKIEIEHPANPDHGDFSTNAALVVFGSLATPGLAKPLALAEMIGKEISGLISGGNRLLAAVSVAPPGFINFRLSKNYLLDQAGAIVSGRFKKNLAAVGRGRTIVVDYSSPNIAKPFGIGHLRSTNIGQAIYNLYAVLGWKTIGDNHLGDWGTQFGVLLRQIKSKKRKAELLTIKDLEKLYVEFHQEAEKKPALKEEAREWFKKLENGDEEAKKIWQACVDVSLKEFARVYKILGAKIDYAYGESFYHFNGWMERVLADAKNKGLLKKSRRALVINLPGQKVPAMLVKSDGATTYILRDLAAIKFRRETWRPDLVVYEVGADQKLHFAQVFAAARLLGYLDKTRPVHVAHGLIRFKTGKLSTRRGKTIPLREVIEEGIKRAGRLTETTATAKNLTEKEKKRIAKAVGVGGIKFNDLKQEPEREVVFDWEKVLSLDGYSAPYLQYAYARAVNVLKKAPLPAGDYQLPITDYRLSMNKEETDLLGAFYRFPEAVVSSAQNFSPHILARYLFGLGQKFNLFYQKNRIIGPSRSADAGWPTERFRLFLTAATAEILKEGLLILGIEPLEMM